MRCGRMFEFLLFIILCIIGLLVFTVGYKMGYKQNIDRQTVIEYQLDRAERDLK